MPERRKTRRGRRDRVYDYRFTPYVSGVNLPRFVLAFPHDSPAIVLMDPDKVDLSARVKMPRRQHEDRWESVLLNRGENQNCGIVLFRVLPAMPGHNFGKDDCLPHVDGSISQLLIGSLVAHAWLEASRLRFSGIGNSDATEKQHHQNTTVPTSHFIPLLYGKQRLNVRMVS